MHIKCTWKCWWSCLFVCYIDLPQWKYLWFKPIDICHVHELWVIHMNEFSHEIIWTVMSVCLSVQRTTKAITINHVCVLVYLNIAYCFAIFYIKPFLLILRSLYLIPVSANNDLNLKLESEIRIMFSHFYLSYQDWVMPFTLRVKRTSSDKVKIHAAKLSNLVSHFWHWVIRNVVPY